MIAPVRRRRESVPDVSGPRAVFLVLQSHYLEPLDSVIVAPIVRDAARVLSVLDVSVEISGEALVVTVGELFSIERDRLKAVRGSLADLEEQIRRAIERAFTGF